MTLFGRNLIGAFSCQVREGHTRFAFIDFMQESRYFSEPITTNINFR